MNVTPRLAGAVFFTALSGLLASFAGLAAYEAYAMATHQRLITDYASAGISRHPRLALATTLAVLGLQAHLWHAALLRREP